MRIGRLLALGFICAPLPVWACAPPADPVLSLDFESRYDPDDTARATPDADRQAAAEAALDPLDAFIRDLSQGLNAALSTDTAADQATQAACLLTQIGVWAAADALSDQATETVALTIGSRLSALALVATRAAGIVPNHPDLPEIRDWLSRRVTAQMTFWETAPDRAGQNNLRAWAALAGAATAGLVEDPVMRGWAAWSVAYVLCSASEDGSLPLEMHRGRLALHYQLHALAPLTTAVLVLKNQGLDLTQRCDDALSRAVRFALSDLGDGQKSASHSGEVQSFFDGSDQLEAWQLAWLEAYLKLDPNPQILALADPLRPLSYSKLGGNQTLYWQAN
ncbi:MAG: alginate lyase family protein [Pseudomonadota bacterium]